MSWTVHGRLPALAFVLGSLLAPSVAVAATDSDNDSMPNAWEHRFGLNPHNRRDATKDKDRDKVINRTEFRNRCNPISKDTDRDGMHDGFEVKYGLNCHSKRDASKDPDHDGLTNKQEYGLGTSPYRVDTDRDGVSDSAEVALGTKPTKPDSDGDVYLDGDDNCPATPNPDQANADGDALGDACDSDLDGDGIANASDNCVATSNVLQENIDGDAQGDACDSDDDGD